jgi:succinate dehydrogenase / fumarate reductase cytochrome b subunit
MKYAYFPGCVAKGACKELDNSLRLIMKKLGIGLTELDAASCCGAGIIGEVKPKLNLALNARTFAQAEKLGMDILTICSTCQGVFEEAKKELKNPKKLSEINKELNKINSNYSGDVNIKHLLWILVKDYGLDKLAKQVKKPLRQIKPAAMYGCHLLRPSSLMKFDDPENPTSMERLFKTLGAKPILTEGRKRCCGFPIIMTNKEASLRLAGKVLLEAKEKGANCIVTACPLCHMNFDSIQPEIEKLLGKEINLPILHLSQLVGLALDLKIEELGLDKHVVSTEKLIHLINI